MGDTGARLVYGLFAVGLLAGGTGSLVAGIHWWEALGLAVALFIVPGGALLLLGVGYLWATCGCWQAEVELRYAEAGMRRVPRRNKAGLLLEARIWEELLVDEEAAWPPEPDEGAEGDDGRNWQFAPDIRTKADWDQPAAAGSVKAACERALTYVYQTGQLSEDELRPALGEGDYLDLFASEDHKDGPGLLVAWKIVQDRRRRQSGTLAVNDLHSALSLFRAAWETDRGHNNYVNKRIMSIQNRYRPAGQGR